MFARYLAVFLIGWGFNGALDANVVARQALAWLQHGWLAAFYDTAPAAPSQTKRR